MPTRRTLIAAALAILMVGYLMPGRAQTSKRIPLEAIEAMFANMRHQTQWNVDGPLLWEYFFSIRI